MKRKIVMVGRDAAPSDCFNQLGPLLLEKGYEVELIVGNGKPLTVSSEQISSEVHSANLVLLGMSSSPELAEHEVFAGFEALEKGIPYGFYGDVPACWARAREGAWFADLAKSADFYLASDEVSAGRASAVFPESTIRVATGNPLRESAKLASPWRQWVREQLGLEDKTKLILAVGGKFPAGNISLWSLLLEAIKLDSNFFDAQLLLATHPGDVGIRAVDGQTGKDVGIYQQLANHSPVPTRVLTLQDKPGAMEVIVGADLVIEHGSTIGVVASYLQRPVITPRVLLLDEALFRESGSYDLELISNGASLFASANPSELAEVMVDALHDSSRQAAMQGRVYPMPESEGGALKKIIQVLEDRLLTE